MFIYCVLIPQYEYSIGHSSCSGNSLCQETHLALGCPSCCFLITGGFAASPLYVAFSTHGVVLFLKYGWTKFLRTWLTSFFFKFQKIAQHCEHEFKHLANCPRCISSTLVWQSIWWFGCPALIGMLSTCMFLSKSVSHRLHKLEISTAMLQLNNGGGRSSSSLTPFQNLCQAQHNLTRLLNKVHSIERITIPANPPYHNQ